MRVTVMNRSETWEAVLRTRRRPPSVYDEVREPSGSKGCGGGCGTRGPRTGRDLSQLAREYDSLHSEWCEPHAAPPERYYGPEIIFEDDETGTDSDQDGADPDDEGDETLAGGETPPTGAGGGWEGPTSGPPSGYPGEADPDEGSWTHGEPEPGPSSGMGGSILLDDDVQSWIDLLTDDDEWPDAMPGSEGAAPGEGDKPIDVTEPPPPPPPTCGDDTPEFDPTGPGAAIAGGVALFFADGPFPVGDLAGTAIIVGTVAAMLSSLESSRKRKFRCYVDCDPMGPPFDPGCEQPFQGVGEDEDVVKAGEIAEADSMNKLHAANCALEACGLPACGLAFG